MFEIDQVIKQEVSCWKMTDWIVNVFFLKLIFKKP